MKSFLFSLLFFIVSANLAESQQKDWRVDLFSFFDNTEFGNSKVTIPQTMAGVMVAPEGGITWDTIHKLNIGANLMHEYGSPHAIDKYYPTAYYEFDRGVQKFIMGAFPRMRVIGNYPRLFFRDSITYYRPNINGIFWEFRKDKNYINTWLDWTGRQSKTVNEAFFIGSSGRYNRGIFFVQQYSYMFHLAGKMDPVVDEALHDNLLFNPSVGIDLAGKTPLTTFEANAGWVTRYERSRAENSGWIKLNGFLMEARFEYKMLGFFDTFYRGDGMMYFYSERGNDLYWGDPVYRAKSYNRSDFYITFLQRKTVNIALTYSLHFLENHVYNEQMLKVFVNLNSL